MRTGACSLSLPLPLSLFWRSALCWLWLCTARLDSLLRFLCHFCWPPSWKCCHVDDDATRPLLHWVQHKRIHVHMCVCVCKGMRERVCVYCLVSGLKRQRRGRQSCALLLPVALLTCQVTERIRVRFLQLLLLLLRCDRGVLVRNIFSLFSHFGAYSSGGCVCAHCAIAWRRQFVRRSLPLSLSLCHSHSAFSAPHSLSLLPLRCCCVFVFFFLLCYLLLFS